MNKLFDFINNFKRANPTGWRKWIVGTIVVLTSTALFVVYSIRAGFKNKELAKLKHDKDVLEEKARSHSLDAVLAKIEKEQDAHEAQATDALQRASELSRQSDGLKDEHLANLEIIDSLLLWGDIDDHVK